jgi:hypothetical protein
MISHRRKPARQIVKLIRTILNYASEDHRRRQLRITFATAYVVLASPATSGCGSWRYVAAKEAKHICLVFSWIDLHTNVVYSIQMPS